MDTVVVLRSQAQFGLLVDGIVDRGRAVSASVAPPLRPASTLRFGHPTGGTEISSTMAPATARSTLQ
jgi:hypothetical protein